MAHKIVFCDIDGTLLDSRLRILPGTLTAIRQLQARGIPFVIVSGRAPGGIKPILRAYDLRCPFIAFGGGQLQDEKGRVLLERGVSMETAHRVIARIEAEGDACCWNLYMGERWIVRSRKDLRVLHEEYEVQALSEEGSPDDFPPDALVHKLMGICPPQETARVEKLLQAAFPELTIVRSSDILIEIMPGGVDKGMAVRAYCAMLGIDPGDAAVAFGDNFNDTAMLEAVGMPILMGNAPEALLARFPNHAEDHNYEGIMKALERLGMIEASLDSTAQRSMKEK